MDPVPGYEIAELGARLRRLRAQLPTSASLRQDPVARGDGARPVRRALARRLARWSRHRARCCAPRSRRRRRSASRRCSAPSSSSSSSGRATRRRTSSTTAISRLRSRTSSTTTCCATSYDEPLIRADQERDEGRRALVVENSKGEAGPGQHEINFRYADALRTADDHVVYKNGAKEIAHQHGCSITFMAKPYHTEVGLVVPHPFEPLARARRAPSRARSDDLPPLPRGADRVRRELAIFLAPTINSYKRFMAASWAPTTLAWGRDNRTCGFRVVGHGPACGRDAHPGRRREPVSRVRGVDRGRAARDRARARAAARGRGQRLRVRRRALPSHRWSRRSPRSSRATMARAAIRRPGGRPLPELRAHGAAALRPGRHVLRARAALRAGMTLTRRQSRRPRSRSRSSPQAGDGETDEAVAQGEGGVPRLEGPRAA